jgi:hypothetical protein
MRPRPIQERSADEIKRLLDATSGQGLIESIREHLGKNVCDEPTAGKIGVALNIKWLLEIKPNLHDKSKRAVDDARIRHADNVLGALKELGAAIDASGNAENLKDRLMGLYDDSRSEGATNRKDRSTGHPRASAIPKGGSQFSLYR